jgi:hypothetical protein
MKGAAGQDVLCEVPGLEKLNCAVGPNQKLKPGDLFGILARKIFVWKIS